MCVDGWVWVWVGVFYLEFTAMSLVFQHDVNTDEKGLPPLLRCTGQKMLETGVYVVGKCSCLVQWGGAACTPVHAYM